MPQVAYYRLTQLEGVDAINHLKAMRDGAIKILGSNHDRVVNLTDWLEDVAENGVPVDCFERVKVEVKDVVEAEKVRYFDGFVRYAIGNVRTLQELITIRKAAGRTDWYC
jgi:hypothetical protein